MRYLVAFLLPLSITWQLLLHLGVDISLSLPLTKLFTEASSWIIWLFGWVLFILAFMAMVLFVKIVQNEKSVVDNDNILRKVLRAITPLEVVGLLVLGNYWVAASLVYSSIVGYLLINEVKRRENTIK